MIPRAELGRLVINFVGTLFKTVASVALTGCLARMESIDGEFSRFVLEQCLDDPVELSRLTFSDLRVDGNLVAYFCIPQFVRIIGVLKQLGPRS